MLESLATRRVLDGEPHFLKSDPTVVVCAEYLDRWFLQRAEDAPLPVRFIVNASPIVVSISGAFGLKERLRERDYP